MRKHLATLLAAVASMIFAGAEGRAADLISNGSFESNGGVGQLENGISYATDWTRTIITNPESGGFAFITNANADSTGFPSKFTPISNTNIYVWGPNTPPGKGGPSNNGFTGSSDGGSFIGINATYGQSSISQSVTGLTVGNQYLLSFQWAQAQFTDSLAASTSGWGVTFGAESTSTGLVALAGKGFNGWSTFTHTFTASSPTQTLTILAQGTTNENPFVLLDGVSLQPVPEPSTYALGTIASGVMAYMARRRKARRA